MGSVNSSRALKISKANILTAANAEVSQRSLREPRTFHTAILTAANAEVSRRSLRETRTFHTACGTLAFAPLRVAGRTNASAPTRSADFERNQVAFGAAARLVVDRDLAIAPVAGKIVGPDQQQGAVVWVAELQHAGFGIHGEHGGRRLGTIHFDQAASGKSGGPLVLGSGLVGFFCGFA